MSLAQATVTTSQKCQQEQSFQNSVHTTATFNGVAMITITMVKLNKSVGMFHKLNILVNDKRRSCVNGSLQPTLMITLTASNMIKISSSVNDQDE